MCTERLVFLFCYVSEDFFINYDFVKPKQFLSTILCRLQLVHFDGNVKSEIKRQPLTELEK